MPDFLHCPASDPKQRKGAAEFERLIFWSVVHVVQA